MKSVTSLGQNWPKIWSCQLLMHTVTNHANFSHLLLIPWEHVWLLQHTHLIFFIYFLFFQAINFFFRNTGNSNFLPSKFADRKYFCKILFSCFLPSVPVPHRKHVANLELRPVFVLSDMIFFGLSGNTWWLPPFNALIVVFTKEIARIREVLTGTVFIWRKKYWHIVVKTLRDL